MKGTEKGAVITYSFTFLPWREEMPMDGKGGIGRDSAGENAALDPRLWEPPVSYAESGLASARLLILTPLAS